MLPAEWFPRSCAGSSRASGSMTQNLAHRPAVPLIRVGRHASAGTAQMSRRMSICAPIEFNRCQILGAGDSMRLRPASASRPSCPATAARAARVIERAIRWRRCAGDTAGRRRAGSHLARLRGALSSFQSRGTGAGSRSALPESCRRRRLASGDAHRAVPVPGFTSASRPRRSRRDPCRSVRRGPSRGSCWRRRRRRW